jgi:hypothetical protein
MNRRDLSRAAGGLVRLENSAIACVEGTIAEREGLCCRPVTFSTYLGVSKQRNGHTEAIIVAHQLHLSCFANVAIYGLVLIVGSHFRCPILIRGVRRLRRRRVLQQMVPRMEVSDDGDDDQAAGQAVAIRVVFVVIPSTSALAQV